MSLFSRRRKQHIDAVQTAVSNPVAAHTGVVENAAAREARKLEMLQASQFTSVAGITGGGYEPQSDQDYDATWGGTYTGNRDDQGEPGDNIPDHGDIVMMQGGDPDGDRQYTTGEGSDYGDALIEAALDRAGAGQNDDPSWLDNMLDIYWNRGGNHDGYVPPEGEPAATEGRVETDIPPPQQTDPMGEDDDAWLTGKTNSIALLAAAGVAVMVLR